LGFGGGTTGHRLNVSDGDGVLTGGFLGNASSGFRLIFLRFRDARFADRGFGAC